MAKALNTTFTATETSLFAIDIMGEAYAEEVGHSFDMRIRRLALNLQFELSQLPGRNGDGMRQIKLDRDGQSYVRLMPTEEGKPGDKDLILVVLRPLNVEAGA